MSIDKKIIYEIERFRTINAYITEQQAPPIEDPNAAPLDLNAPTADLGAQETNTSQISPIPPSTEPQPSDMEATAINPMTDDDVVKIDNEGNNMETGEAEESDSEELDITDLVVSQQDIQTSQEKFFGKLFGQIDKMEQKLSEINGIMDRLDNIDKKIEKYREPTPQEKLELRSLDSYPFTQKLSTFFDEKQSDLQKTKKNEYVLKPEDVSNFNDNQIKDTFSAYDEDEDTFEA